MYIWIYRLKFCAPQIERDTNFHGEHKTSTGHAKIAQGRMGGYITVGLLGALITGRLITERLIISRLTTARIEHRAIDHWEFYYTRSPSRCALLVFALSSRNRLIFGLMLNKQT